MSCSPRFFALSIWGPIVSHRPDSFQISPGTITVDLNSNKTLTITANKGYKLTLVKVNGTETITNNGILELKNIQEDQNIEVLTERIVYEVIEGANQTYTILKDDIASVLFGELSIDKKRIEIRKLRKKGLSKEHMDLFLKLIDYIGAF